MILHGLSDFYGELSVGNDNLEKVDKIAKNYGLKTLFVTRIFLGQFHDIISYLFGLTNVKFRRYIIISTLGTIPGAVLWYFIASNAGNPTTFMSATVVITYGFLAAYFLWLKLTKKIIGGVDIWRKTRTSR